MGNNISHSDEIIPFPILEYRTRSGFFRDTGYIIRLHRCHFFSFYLFIGITVLNTMSCLLVNYAQRQFTVTVCCCVEIFTVVSYLVRLDQKYDLI